MINMHILVRSNVDSWDSWKKMATTSVSSVNPLNNTLICFILYFLGKNYMYMYKVSKLHVHV